MKRLTVIAFIIALLSLSNAAHAQLKKVYNDDIDPMEQIDRAIAQANEQGKYVICQVGGNWCPWCLKFAKFITDDEEINQYINQNYVYIHVSYNPHQSKDEARDKAMLKRLGNPGRFGYPVFVVLDEKGNVIHIQDSSYLEEGKSYHKDKVLQFFINWTPKAVRGEK